MEDLPCSVDRTRPAPGRNNEPSVRRHRAPCAAVVALVLSTLLVGQNYHRHVVWPLVVNSDQIRRVRIGVDPNTAAWFELAQLPGIGESLAHRITEFRDSRSSATEATSRPVVVFKCPADLTQVKGIGAATLLKISPYLYLSGSGNH